MSFLDFAPFANQAATPTVGTGRSKLLNVNNEWFVKTDAGIFIPLKGRTILNGTGAPAGSLGDDGDFYIDTAANDFYGPKTAGVWGSGTSLVGPTGATGPAGPAGPQGPQGPVALEFVDENSTLITMPDSTAKNVVRTWSVTLSQTADYEFDLIVAMRPHSTGNDMEWDTEFDGTLVGNAPAEEHKDVSAAQAHNRPFGGQLGNVAAGTYDFDLRFSKEATGGTAQLKYTYLRIWRTS